MRFFTALMVMFFVTMLNLFFRVCFLLIFLLFLHCVLNVFDLYITNLKYNQLIITFYTCYITIFNLIMKLIFLTLLLSLIFGIHCIVDRTYFNYLGLKITASSQDVQRAYNEKKIKIEGLNNQQEKEKKLKLLKQAYDTLINDKQRQKYERYGRDVFRSIKEMTCIDKRNPQSPKDQRKSSSFKLTLPVSIGDIYNGTVIKAKYPKMVACPICQGTGAKSPKDLKPCSQCGAKGFSLRDQQNFYGQKFQAETICPVCRGQGKTVTKSCDHCKGAKLIAKQQIIEIPIEKGLPNGNTFTLKNFGEQGLLGAPSDFEITVVQIPTEKWSRDNNNLVYLMQISLEQSLFGFVKSFEHLDGQTVTVNREGQITTKETKHIIKQKGTVNKQGYMGNLIIRFKVTIPQFTDEQLDMWQDFFNEYPM